MTRGPLSLRTGLFVSVSLGVLAASLPAARAQDAQGAGADLQAVEKQIQDLQKELRRLKAELAKEARAKAEAAKKAQAQAQPAAGVAAPSNAAIAPGGGVGTAAGIIPAAGLAQSGQPAPAVPQTLPPEIAPPPAGGVSVNPVPPPLTDQLPITTVPPPPGSDSLYSASPAILTQMAPGYSLRVGGLALTLGGYVEAPIIYRNHSEVAGINSSFGGGIPLPNTPQYYMGEVRGDARQSRWAALAQGNISDAISVAAYLEGDFISSPITANAIQSNSYTPRWRLYYA